jgi:molybdate transport system substrate-binding protein
LGFLALSQVIENGKIVGGSSWIIPDNLHAPIRQGAVLMKKGAENPAARALIDYLKSIPALAIINKYGYDLAK